MLRYISHAQVQIDPDVPVPKWSLNEHGAARVRAMLAQPWVSGVARVVSSAETKALETAAILAAHLDLEVEIREKTGETDRSATGFVPHDRHVELANQFFAHPAQSAHGWERAVDVQRRMVEQTKDLLKFGRGDTALVGHGAAGTLLYCHLAQLPISRDHDQPDGGYYWTWDTAVGRMAHAWHPIDDLAPVTSDAAGTD